MYIEGSIDLLKQRIFKIVSSFLAIIVLVIECAVFTVPVQADSDSSSVWKNVNGRKYLYNSNGKCISDTGIDVSRWEEDIDWEKVAGDDIQFAIIRVGHGHGDNWEDIFADANMEGCEKNGIPYGVYYYSEATTEEEAVLEANNLISRLKGRNPEIGVFVDIEATDAYEEAGINPYTEGEKIVKLADIILNMIGGAGYIPGIYANTDYFDNVLYPASHFYSAIRWVARYYNYNDNKVDSNPIPEGDWDIWQYGSTGKVSGINGNVDLDARLTEPYDRDYSDISSGVFQQEQELVDVYNYTYYIQHNQDVLDAYGYNDRQGVLNHFLSFGMKEGRMASESFDVYAYMNNYPDLCNAFGDDMEKYYYHYLNYGKKEGRIADHQFNNIWNGTDYSLVFDADYYAAKRPDVVNSCGKSQRALLQHFVYNGMAEGTQASPVFDPAFYRTQYKDLDAACGKECRKYYYHFMNCGVFEGRRGSSEFDPLVYRNNYSDLEKTFGNNWPKYYYHYLKNGKLERREAIEQLTNVWLGIDYSLVFDENYYREKRPDVVQYIGNSKKELLYHFVNFGMAEGVQACTNFSPVSYRNRYFDLSTTFGDDWKRYYIHFIRYGYREGRIAVDK